ncbi:hypothetical protein GOB83_08320 [Acetobacter fabarum]|uniref:hypothetical protein n=1 Tax=Acetobacter fabarum TaxID=483199 RepID=UPI00140446E1|nr:hypothetical protein [Acetobacter fabarum]NHO42183.1 hypothetical protein [Acetobacter fabarum]GBQ32826.1 hypothetical protein AA19596_1012 [Acetobacter fabarum DSM 19596]
MKHILLCSAMLGLAAAPAMAAPHTATPAPAAATAEASYPMATFMGAWTVRAEVPAFTVAGNRAMGPAARLLVNVPEVYAANIGESRFSLAQKSGSSWSGTQHGTTMTMTLISPNAGHILITNTNGHKVDVPLYRNDP